MDKVIFDNMVQDYLFVLGVILLVLVFNRLISKYIAIFLCKLFKRGWKTFDQQKFIDLIINPLGTFLVITVSIVAMYRLNFPSALDVKVYKYPLHQIILSIAITVQIIAFTWLLLRFIDFIASVMDRKAAESPSPNENQLIVFFRDFLKVIFGIVGFMMILKFAFNYNVNSLLTGLSIVGAAIALALRESLENLIASFVIFFDKPFITGDTVKVQNVTGTIEKIGLRSTRIRSEQKTFITVPNKQMVDSILDNHSLRTQQKNELILQIGLETPSPKIEELMGRTRDYLSRIPEIETYNVLFTDINVHAYAILIEFFIPVAYLKLFNRIRQDVNIFTLKTIEELDIKIAGTKKEVVPVTERKN